MEVTLWRIWTYSSHSSKNGSARSIHSRSGAGQDDLLARGGTNRCWTKHCWSGMSYTSKPGRADCCQVCQNLGWKPHGIDLTISSSRRTPLTSRQALLDEVDANIRELELELDSSSRRYDYGCSAEDACVSSDGNEPKCKGLFRTLHIPMFTRTWNTMGQIIHIIFIMSTFCSETQLQIRRRCQQGKMAQIHSWRMWEALDK